VQRWRRHRLFGYSADGRTHGLGPPFDGCLGGSIRCPDRHDVRPHAHRNTASNRNAASNSDTASNSDGAFDCDADYNSDAAFDCDADGNSDGAFDCDADRNIDAAFDCDAGDAGRREHEHAVPPIPTYHTAVESLVHDALIESDAGDVERGRLRAATRCLVRLADVS
jgi:hypothetical protein